MESGYRQRTDERPVAEDPDFHALVDDPEFQRLAELTKPVSQRDVYRQLDFILGQWTLTSPDGRRIGSAEFSASSGGYAIVGKCSDNTRATNSTIMAYYEPSVAQWKQVWLDDQGSVAQLTRQPGDDDAIVFEGESIMADGRRAMARVILDEAADGRVRLSLMTSSDAGNRWSDVLDVKLIPKKVRNSQAASEPESPTE